MTNFERHERFKSEIASVERCDHPNIIRILDHSLTATTDPEMTKHYIVMPLAQGGNLAQRKLRYQYNPETTIDVAIRLADALRSGHKVRVIHRDVNPENILFPGNGHDVWLADFGIAYIGDQPRHTETGEVVGPAHFIARS